MVKTLFSFGHGYSAQALAQLLVPQGWRVIGTTRSPEKFGLLRAQGVEPVAFPGGDLSALEQASHLLISAGPGEAGDPVSKYMMLASKATILTYII